MSKVWHHATICPVRKRVPADTSVSRLRIASIDKDVVEVYFSSHHAGLVHSKKSVTHRDAMHLDISRSTGS
jgi:hypothetical protein